MIGDAPSNTIPAAELIAQFLREMDKPIVLAIARPVHKASFAWWMHSRTIRCCARNAIWWCLRVCARG